MTRSFPEFYDYYISVVKEKSFLNGKQMQVDTVFLEFDLFPLLVIVLHLCKEPDPFHSVVMEAAILGR